MQFFYLLRILNFRRIFFGMILIDVGIVREMKQKNSNMILLAIFQILSLGLFVVKINSAILPKATFFFGLSFLSGINNVLDARSVGMKIFEDYAISWYWILM